MKQRLRPSRNLTLVGGNEAVTATARGTMEKTMKAKWLTLTLALAFAGGAAFAHGNKVHVKGTVEKIDGGSLQVRTPEARPWRGSSWPPPFTSFTRGPSQATLRVPMKKSPGSSPNSPAATRE